MTRQNVALTATTQDEVKLSRRSHHKSRSGCGSCKKRRVKCDETHPSCTQCIKFSIPCDFDPSSHNTTTKPEDIATPSQPRRRGRPRKHWALIPTSSTSTLSSPKAVGSQPETPDSGKDPLSQGLNASDLELLHHYTTDTYRSLADERLWQMHQVNYPRIGFQHHCVLHTILAFSAAHLARLQPSRYEKYAALGDTHSTYALRGASELIAKLDATNCQAVFASSTLIPLYMLGKGPTTGDYLLFGDKKGVNWGYLVKGVRTLMLTIDRETLYSGLLAPMLEAPPQTKKQTVADREGRARILWEDAFDALKRHIESSDTTGEAETCLQELQSLEMCYQANEGRTGQDGYEGDEGNQTVMVWIWRLTDEFYASLDLKKALALTVFAYFCPLLKTLDPQRWYIKGWPEHILQGIEEAMDEEWRSWLA